MATERQEQLKLNAETLLSETKAEISKNADEQIEVSGTIDSLEKELEENVARNKEIRDQLKAKKANLKVLKEEAKPLVKEEKFLQGTVDRLTKKEDE